MLDHKTPAENSHEKNTCVPWVPCYPRLKQALAVTQLSARDDPYRCARHWDGFTEKINENGGFSSKKHVS